jgi:hypothetical protein
VVSAKSGGAANLCRRSLEAAAQAFSIEDRKAFKSPARFRKHHVALSLAQNVDVFMRWAALEHASGASADRVREIYRKPVEAWVQLLPDVDFRPRTFQSEPDEWGNLKEASEAVARFDGKIIEKQGNRYRWRWRAIPQPWRDDVQQAFECAAISGDRELAERIASAYPLYPAHQITNRVEVREAILRHLLAGDDHQAEQLSRRLAHGYDLDFPQQRIELPQGVVRRNSAKLRVGIKAINTRFNTKWDERPLRNRQERLAAQPRAAWAKKDFEWERFADRARSSLAGLRWLNSTWALAFLNIAAWRGITKIFDQPKLFSRWVPLDLAR